MIKIMAISGSTRQHSTNHQLIAAIKERYATQAEMTLFEGLTELPHFNPDLDHEQPPAEVAAFRAQLRAADAVLICTPEYAIGVPGSLKNALDWTVSSMEFSQKPVGLITAGTSGVHAHKSLLGTLLIIESRMREEMQLVIPAVKTKISPEGVITHGETLTAIDRLMHSLLAVAAQPREDDAYLHPPAFHKA